MSICLVLVIILTIIVGYYNLFLVFRNRPPFKVMEFCPQILFPRGERGLGRHMIEEEDKSELEPLNQIREVR